MKFNLNATTGNRESGRTDLRKVVFNCNAGLLVLIGLALLIVVNLLAARFSFRWDTTKNHQYSLSGQTIQILKELDRRPDQLMVYGFYRSGDRDQQETVRDLLREYQKKSAKISFQMIDPYKNPGKARQFHIQELGTLVVTSGVKELSILPGDMFQQSYYGPAAFSGEQALTRAISKILSADTKKLYLLQGHGEKEYQSARNYITGEGYEMASVNLMKDGKFPGDCAQLIIAGPQTDLSGPELKLIEDYLGRGGRLLLLLDYLPGKSRIPNIIKLINEWGIDVEDSMVVELERHALFDYTTIIPNYLEHAITAKLKSTNTNVVLPANRSLIKLKNYKGDAEVATILESSGKSWGETNPRGHVTQNPAETTGPIPLAIVSQRPDKGGKESRMIVVGTATFLDDDFVSQAGNLNLFYNMTQWLLGQEDRISILPKQVDITRATLTAAQAGLIRWLVLVILPVLILGSGAVIWFRRRAR